MAVTTTLTWEEEKSLQKLFENVSFSLLYKAHVHGNSIEAMLDRCSLQGPTITVIYLSNYIIGAFIHEDYPEMDEDFTKQISSFYFSLTNNAAKIATAFLNTTLEITSKKLTFYSSKCGDTFSLIPEKAQVCMHPSLKTKLGLKYLPVSSKYKDCEVFRVEGIKNEKGYISRITGATQHRNGLLEDLRAYKPCENLVSEVRILLLGPVGSGKSSFFNSVKSVFQGHVTRQAAVGSDTTSITELYRIYSIKEGKDGKSLPFMLCDSMGLSEEEGVGLCLDDIPHILKGCIPDRYQFRPQQPITSSHPTFIISPSLKDRIHCVAYVFDFNCINDLSSKMVAKFKQIQKEVLNCGVPQVALLTNVKNYHEVLQDNFLNVEKSMTSQSQIMNVQKVISIPISHILMVENYATEWELDPVKDILILSALRQMLRAVDDSLEDLPLGKTDEVARMSQLCMCD